MMFLAITQNIFLIFSKQLIVIFLKNKSMFFLIKIKVQINYINPQNISKVQPKTYRTAYNNYLHKNTISPQNAKYTIEIPAPYPLPTFTLPTKIQ